MLMIFQEEPIDYGQIVMILLFIKRLNDAFEENIEKLMQQGKSEKEAYGNKNGHYFFLLEDDMVCSLRCDRNITKDTIIKRS
jgi:hypothetical protein